MKSINRALRLIILGVFFCLFSFSSFASDFKWELNGTDWYLIMPSGQRVVNEWAIMNDTWYYFGTDGKMYSNTYTPDGYWVDSNGAWDGKAAIQIQSVGPAIGPVTAGQDNAVQKEIGPMWKWICDAYGNWYYENISTGELRTGWIYVDDYWYYMDQNGKMLTGLIDLEENGKTVTYYLNDGRSSEMSGRPYGAMAANIKIKMNWEIFKTYCEREGFSGEFFRNISEEKAMAIIKNYEMSFDRSGRAESSCYIMK